MRDRTKGRLLKAIAVVIDVAAPLAATLTQFPIWVEKSSEATVSGLFLLFALLSAIPFMRQIKAFFKSPSVWVLWCIIFVMLIVLEKIIAEMKIVCFVGVISNVIGAGIYKLGKMFEERSEGGGV